MCFAKISKYFNSLALQKTVVAIFSNMCAYLWVIMLTVLFIVGASVKKCAFYISSCRDNSKALQNFADFTIRFKAWQCSLTFLGVCAIPFFPNSNVLACLLWPTNNKVRLMSFTKCRFNSTGHSIRLNDANTHMQKLLQTKWRFNENGDYRHLF